MTDQGNQVDGDARLFQGIPIGREVGKALVFLYGAEKRAEMVAHESGARRDLRKETERAITDDDGGDPLLHLFRAPGLAQIDEIVMGMGIDEARCQIGGPQPR